MGLMWSYYCGGSAEYQKRLKWDQEAEAKTWDLQEQEKVERKIQKRVGRLRYKLERLNLKKNQLGDGRIQKAEDLVSGNSARHDALLYKKMDEKRAWIRNLEAVVKNLRYEMSRMVRCQNLDSCGVTTDTMCQPGRIRGRCTGVTRPFGADGEMCVEYHHRVQPYAR